jgi:hypothetical protein
MIPEKRILFNAVYFPVSGNEVTFTLLAEIAFAPLYRALFISIYIFISIYKGRFQA